MKEFYYGTPWKWPLLNELLPRYILSYNMARGINKPWEFPERRPFMMDSAGYVVGAMFEDYPWSVDTYIKGVEKWNPDIACVMDYPCEPEVRKKRGYTTREAQLRTNLNAAALIDADRRFMSVVQGWELEDYLENIDLLKEEGLITERLGIGSICRRTKAENITRIIKAIKNNVPGWVKLHGFGVKTQILRTEARFLLYSADSQAWTMRIDRELKDRKIPHPYTQSLKIPLVKEYVAKMEAMVELPDPLYAHEEARL